EAQAPEAHEAPAPAAAEAPAVVATRVPATAETPETQPAPEAQRPPAAAEPAGSLIERASEARAAAPQAPAPQRYELPPDMVMIETSPAARHTPEEEPQAEDSTQPRRPRRQPAGADVPEEPLVQIETRK